MVKTLQERWPEKEPNLGKTKPAIAIALSFVSMVELAAACFVFDSPLDGLVGVIGIVLATMVG